MANTSEGGRSQGPLYFIVGGLVVAVGIGAYILYGGDRAGTPVSTTTTTEQSTTPTVEGGSATTTTTEETQQ